MFAEDKSKFQFVRYDFSQVFLMPYRERFYFCHQITKYMSHFHSLKVKEVRRETADAVSVSFEIPESLKADFRYQAGQYITLRSNVQGEDVRRSYSLCSAPFENDFRIAVKAVEGGKMSNWINTSLKAGDAVDVMAPVGNFVVNTQTGAQRKYVAFVAGSGITPVMSIIKQVLRDEGSSHFTLFYGNRTPESVIFRQELSQLVSQSAGRLHVYHVYSRSQQDDAVLNGRINGENAIKMLRHYNGINADAFMLCGPGDMIVAVDKALQTEGVAKDKILYEFFTAPVATESAVAASAPAETGVSKVKVVMDGIHYDFDLDYQGKTILDAAMDAGVDAPFSCKGAVCCTCKAKITKGAANMEMNYALSDSEVEEGFVLTCQAHPCSPEIEVDYDVI
jgi:ring-1,2-phenylacetyl-CoA epoxidase subunit PaaE